MKNSGGKKMIRITKKLGVLLVLLIIATLSSGVVSAQRHDISSDVIYPGGPTYAEVVRIFFETHVFPARLEYEGVGVSRDNVIVERVERNGNSFWITVRSRYSGNIFGIGVADRARVHYDNGHIQVDLGGLIGVLNTQSIADLLDQLITERLSDTFDRIHFRNDCNRSVYVAIRYMSLNGNWVTGGWWHLEPGESNYVADTRNTIYYYYAESDDPTHNRLYWLGDDTYKHIRGSEREYGFRRNEITTTTWGEWTQILTCN